jgi:acetyltransferase-like isoleucine patch superfamily enzyme
MITKKELIETLELTPNKYHPMVHILGNPKIGEGTYIGLYSEINATKAIVSIGEECDIASFVAINCADSHKMTIGLKKENERGDITIEDNVFIGSHSFIGKNTYIGHNSVIGAGSIVIGLTIPPYSLVCGNPAIIKEGYYLDQA